MAERRVWDLCENGSWHSSIHIIPRVGLLIVSWISCMFCIRSFYIFPFLWLFYQCFLWYLLHLRFSLHSLVFCCWCLDPWLLTSFLDTLCPELFPFVVSLLFLDPGWLWSNPLHVLFPCLFVFVCLFCFVSVFLFLFLLLLLFFLNSSMASPCLLVF